MRAQGTWLNDTRTLVRSLLGAQKRFAVELDDVGTAVRTTPGPVSAYLALNEWFLESQLPLQTINLSFIVTHLNNKLTDLHGD